MGVDLHRDHDGRVAEALGDHLDRHCRREYEQLESGLLRISVPERAGHDDVSMSLMLTALPLMSGELEPEVITIVTDEDLFPELAECGSIAPY
jgi:hypothetical protein